MEPPAGVRASSAARPESLGAPAHLRSNIVAGIKHLPVDLNATPVRSS